SYLTTDHLGSTRVVTDGNGGVKSRHDYLPFGEEIPGTAQFGRSGVSNYGSTDGVRQKFSEKERDSESGLDYFGARYYSSAQGRFCSADLESPHLPNPQTLNRYRYALNNPLLYIDPDGHQEKEKGWVERVKEYLLSYFKSKGGDVQLRDQEEPPHYSSSP